MVPRNLVSLKSSGTTLPPVRKRDLGKHFVKYPPNYQYLLFSHFFHDDKPLQREFLVEVFNPREEVFRYRWSDLRGTARTVVSETFWWYQYFCLTSTITHKCHKQSLYVDVEWICVYERVTSEFFFTNYLQKCHWVLRNWDASHAYTCIHTDTHAKNLIRAE